MIGSSIRCAADRVPSDGRRVRAGVRRAAGLAVCLVLLGGGCASAPPRFYTLGSPSGTDQRPAAGTSAGAPIQFDLAQVSVPERLARPQLVIRQAGDPRTAEVEVLEQSRWSAPFDSELRDALGAAIAVRLGGVDVTRGGRLPGQPVYRITVQLRHFDMVATERVDATFGWTLVRPDDGRIASCQASRTERIRSAGRTTRAAADGSETDALVQAVRTLVWSTADDIAAQLRLLHGGQAVRCD